MAYTWLWGLAAAACLVARPASESSAVARDGPAEVVGANGECMSSCRRSSHQCELGWLQEVVAGVHTVMGASDGSWTCHIQYVTSRVCCWHMLWCRPMAEVGVRCKPMPLWEPRPLAWTLTIANARQGTCMTWSELLSCMRDHKNQTHCRCWFQAPVWGWEREQERSQAGRHENVGGKNLSGETSGALGRLWLPQWQKLLGSSVEQTAIVHDEVLCDESWWFGRMVCSISEGDGGPWQGRLGTEFIQATWWPKLLLAAFLPCSEHL